jgi:hypothetical protein
MILRVATSYFGVLTIYICGKIKMNMNIDLHFGHPDSYDYETLIDQFSGTKINSIRTSSVPLVQFWKNTKKHLYLLFDTLRLQAQDVALCFEYPTKPLKGKGKSSMTDLMIIGHDFKIAIEAKFTEYVKMNSEPISKWLQKGDNQKNKEEVLGYWKDLIRPFSQQLNESSIVNIDYQFFHRTASACKDVEKAYVVYQIFYDAQTKNGVADYKNKLMTYVKLLNPNQKINFYAWEIEIGQLLQDNINTDPFFQMRDRDVYKILNQGFTKL